MLEVLINALNAGKKKSISQIASIGRSYKVLRYPILMFLVAFIFVYNFSLYFCRYVHMREKLARAVALGMCFVMLVVSVDITALAFDGDLGEPAVATVAEESGAEEVYSEETESEAPEESGENFEGGAGVAEVLGDEVINLDDEQIVEDETTSDEDADAAEIEETLEETEEEAVEAEEAEEEEAEESEALEQVVTVDDVEITVSADAGVFPNGAVVTARKVESSEEEAVSNVIDQVRDDDTNVAVSYTYDITVYDEEGNEIQPDTEKGAVRVSFKMAEVANENLQTEVYHIEETDGGMNAVELSVNTGDENEAVVETTGFSYYTVEFTYNGLQYVLNGDEKVELSTILETVGIAENDTIKAVESSNTELFNPVQEEDVWYVEALQAFDTEEWLKVTIGEIEYEIVVTDDQEVTTWDELKTALADSSEATIILQDDVTAPGSGSGSLDVNGIKTLDLNGYVINANNRFRVLNVKNGATLTLNDTRSDSTHSDPSLPVVGGVITGGNATGGSGINIESNAIFNMHGGTIYNNTGNKNTNIADRSTSGGGVRNEGAFNMYGGAIRNNHSKYGAAVLLVNGTFTMSDGSITDNITYNQGNGAGVYFLRGTFKMTGGVIKDNNSSYSGGGVYVAASEYILGEISIILGGTAQIYDNIGYRDWKGKTTEHNLYIHPEKIPGSIVSIATGGDAPKDGMNVHVTTNPDDPAVTSPIQITHENDKDYSKYFKSDKSSLIVGNLEDNKLYVGKPLNITNATPEISKDTNNGYIVVDKSQAIYQEEVNVTVHPNSGYFLESLKYNNNNTDITENKKFNMPGNAVTVTATFGNGYILDYKNETLVAKSDQFEISSEDAEAAIPLVNDKVVPGNTYYVREKEGSDWTLITIPGRPAAPTGVSSVDVSANSTKDGKITGVDNTMEYYDENTSSWKSVTGNPVTGLSVGTYQVRIKATATSFASASVTVTIKQAQTAPGAGEGYSIDYEHETITANTDYEISISNGEPVEGPTDGKIQPGNTYYVRKKGDGTHSPSAWTPIKVPDRPGKPTDVSSEDVSADGTTLGKITGVDNTMEYYDVNTSSWNPVTDNPVPDLSEGTYRVRKKATANSFASESVEVTIKKAQTAPGEKEGYTINCEAETITPGAGYEIVTFPDGSPLPAGGKINPGEKYQIRKVGNDTLSPSAWTTITVPNRPDKPTDVSSEDVSADGTTLGKITGVDNTMEYYDKNTSSWKPVTGNPVTGLSVGTYQVRKKATATSFVSESVTVTIKQAQDAPNAGDGYSIDYEKETITASPADEYEISTSNGTDVNAPDGGKIEPGKYYYVRKKGDETHSPSAWTTITIPARPAKPGNLTPTSPTTMYGTDGKISGVNDTMEYSLDGGKTWKPISGNEITGLSSGTIKVRVKAIPGSSLASESIDITVPNLHVRSSNSNRNNNSGSQGEVVSLEALRVEEEMELPLRIVLEDKTQVLKEHVGIVPEKAYNLSVFVTAKGFASALNRIAKAHPKAKTIMIYTGKPFSFNRGTIEAIRKGGKTVVYYFRHKGHLYSVTVPANVDPTKVLEKSGHAGPLYVGKMLGTTRLIQ